MIEFQKHALEAEAGGHRYYLRRAAQELNKAEQAPCVTTMRKHCELAQLLLARAQHGPAAPSADTCNSYSLFPGLFVLAGRRTASE